MLKILSSEYKNTHNAVLVLGTFDGVHLGHQALLMQAAKMAKEKSAPLILYTFSNIPADYFSNRESRMLLLENEREEMLGKCGVDMLNLLPFDETVAQMDPGEFLDRMYEDFHPSVMAVGFNYSFGKGASGRKEDLCGYASGRGIASWIQPAVTDGEGETISSSRIRQSIAEGNVSKVQKLLGYRYFISGEVVRGNRIGHRLGFPTMNLSWPATKLSPKYGVYFSHTEWKGKEYPSITNIGMRPTIADKAETIAETYVLGFENELYGEKITVHLEEYLRPERKFGSLDELKLQLNDDIRKAKNYFFDANK